MINSITGGNPPYSFTWLSSSNNVSSTTSSSAYALSADDYSLTVTDNKSAHVLLLVEQYLNQVH